MKTSTYRGILAFVKVTRGQALLAHVNHCLYCWSLDWSQLDQCLMKNIKWRAKFGEAMRQPRHEIKNQEGLGCWTIHYRQDEYCVIKDGHLFDSSSSKNSGQITKHSLHDVTDLKHRVLLTVKTEVILGRQTDTDTVTVSLQH